MINPKHIGALVSRHTADVEAGRLRFFAQATGQTDPRYVNVAAALRRGDPALPVPPTFLYCLDMDAPNPRALIELLDIDIGRVLHGEQTSITHVGDAITCRGTVVGKDDATRTLRIAVNTRNQAGEIKLSGEALVALDT
jgi:N-terminal half of MaoC dehydratase